PGTTFALSHLLHLLTCSRSLLFTLFFFNDTSTTEIYTLSLHDALPILRPGSYELVVRANNSRGIAGEAHVPVEVGGADINGLIVAIHPRVDVKVRLLMEGGTNIDLRTLEFFLEQRERGLFRLRPSQPIDANGVVTFSNVPPSL